jgi:uncharacterized membrane protein
MEQQIILIGGKAKEIFPYIKDLFEKLDQMGIKTLGDYQKHLQNSKN